MYVLPTHFINIFIFSCSSLHSNTVKMQGLSVGCMSGHNNLIADYLHYIIFYTFFFRIRFRKTQPALAVRPITANPYTALIEFTSGYSGDWRPLTVSFNFRFFCCWITYIRYVQFSLLLQGSINNFLSSYGHGKYPGSSLKCNRLNLPINESVYSKDNWCHVSRRRLVDFTHDVHCSKNDDWGYALAEPCILLKVNYYLLYTEKTQ